MRDELRRRNAEWTRAWLERDATAVDRIMDPTFLYVAPTGEVVDRTFMLGIVESPTFALEWGARSEVRVLTIDADTAAVVCRWRGAGTYEHRFFEDDHRVTSVFARKDGAWKIVLEHCSAIAGAEADDAAD